VAAIEDDASHFAVELLAPWESSVAAVKRAIDVGEKRDKALAEATAILAKEFALPGPAAAARAGMVLDSLGVRRSFFDR
jgi:hypothetical protein